MRCVKRPKTSLKRHVPCSGRGETQLNPLQSSIAKLQTVTLAAKLVVLNPTHRTLSVLSRYVFSLARYDTDYDVRDRARTLGSLLAGVFPALRAGTGEENFPEAQGGVVLRREQVKVVLFEGKAEFSEHAMVSVENDFLGSISMLLGKELPGDRYLPDWPEEGTDSSLRDTEDDNPPLPVYAQRSVQGVAVSSRVASPVVLTPVGAPSPVGSMSHQRGQWKDLDLNKFYDDDSEEEESEDESEDDLHNAQAQQSTHVALDTESDEEEESEEESDENDHSLSHPPGREEW